MKSKTRNRASTAKRVQKHTMDEIVEKVQRAMLAIQDVENTLEEHRADPGLRDSCALAAEGMGNLACDLGFGVINGVMVPR